MAETEVSFKLVYILGAGHCGSTLLGLLLNGHSQGTALCEVFRIQSYFNPSRRIRTPLLQVPFWKRVSDCWDSKSENYSFDKIDINTRSLHWTKVWQWGPERHARYILDNKILFQCVANVSGTRVIVDGSKDWKRLYLLLKSEAFDIEVIHLVRDGRAIVNSYMRKYGLFYYAVRRWAAPAITAFFLRRITDESKWHQIQYESLATRPEQVLTQICQALGVEYEPEMLSFRSHPYVGLGGNRMRFGKDEEIALDEQWRHELPRWQRIKLALIGGWLNRFYGYE